MRRINNFTKQTNNKYLNMYDMEVVKKTGKISHYQIATRATSEAEMKCNQSEAAADAVAVVGIYGENQDKVVLVKQYRYAAGDYVYELPAGLVDRDKGEDAIRAAVREFKEETGLDLEVYEPECEEDEGCPGFTSVGMSDETKQVVFGYADGTVSDELLEEGEDLVVEIVDEERAQEILYRKDIKKSLVCMQALQLFLHDQEYIRLSRDYWKLKKKYEDLKKSKVNVFGELVRK